MEFLIALHFFGIPWPVSSDQTTPCNQPNIDVCTMRGQLFHSYPSQRVVPFPADPKFLLAITQSLYGRSGGSNNCGK